MSRTILILATALLLLACTAGSDTGVPAAGPRCIEGGAFRADLYGAVRSELDWRGANLTCEGMRRPHGAGARLRFAGEIPLEGAARNLAIIVALPELEPGATGKELRATVTLIEEDSGRFFSNAEQETCWADIIKQQPLAASPDSYAVSGIVYCVAPLAALKSKASITIRDLSFAGRVDWHGDNE